MKPLLSLVMIVKNEAATIEKTLRSCKDIIDRWTILDTGSTDDTRAIIERVLGGIPGSLRNAPFIDYSQARNTVLALEDQATFALMLSGGETIAEGATDLRVFCQDHVDDAEGAYDVEVRMGANRYPHPRLTRVSAGWRYSGKTHEVLLPPSGNGYAQKRVADTLILHEKNETEAQLRTRWRRDVELLEAEWMEKQNPRTAFYLAQTYECLGELHDALLWYGKRINLPNGFYEEIYISKYRSANITLSITPSVGIVEMLNVFDYAPHRAEPLYELGLFYYRQEMFEVALLFALRAAQMPYPHQDRLFVTESYYRWQAWDLVACCAKSDTKLALEAAKKAVEGDPENERLKANLRKLEEQTQATPG